MSIWVVLSLLMPVIDEGGRPSNMRDDEPIFAFDVDETPASIVHETKSDSRRSRPLASAADGRGRPC